MNGKVVLAETTLYDLFVYLQMVEEEEGAEA